MRGHGARGLLPLLALAACLGGCGFHPVYAKRDTDEATRSDTRAALEGVRVETVNSRPGQILQTVLEDTIYPGRKPATKTRYIFSAIPTLLEYPAVIESNQFVARTNVRIMLAASLRDATTDAPLWSTSTFRLSSFNASQADYATFVARDDAIERGIRAAGEDLVMQLQAYLSSSEKQRAAARPAPDAVLPGVLPGAIPGSVPNSVYPGNAYPGNGLPGLGTNGASGFATPATSYGR